MPVALSEALSDSSNWREQVNRDSASRLLLVLRSFISMYEQCDLSEFFIICPDAQCAMVRQIVAIATRDPRYIVFAETSVVPAIRKILAENLDGLGGWYAQQAIKLAAYALVKTPYYFVFDSDIVCVRPCNYASFVVDNRPLANVECEEDYIELYGAGFAEKEARIKLERRMSSLVALGIDPSKVDPRIFYGETPVILSTEHVPLVLRQLEKTHRLDWLSALCRRKGWTEYGLYFGYLDANNITPSLYKLMDCNAVLDLQRSVWQLSSRYQNARNYDRAHFFDGPSGYFVALQSWIPACEWLPSQFSSVHAFYCEMDRWIQEESPIEISS
jgi:hypothetical protein